MIDLTITREDRRADRSNSNTANSNPIIRSRNIEDLSLQTSCGMHFCKMTDDYVIFNYGYDGSNIHLLDHDLKPAIIIKDPRSNFDDAVLINNNQFVTNDCCDRLKLWDIRMPNKPIIIANEMDKKYFRPSFYEGGSSSTYGVVDFGSIDYDPTTKRLVLGTGSHLVSLFGSFL